MIYVLHDHGAVAAAEGAHGGEEGLVHILGENGENGLGGERSESHVTVGPEDLGGSAVDGEISGEGGVDESLVVQIAETDRLGKSFGIIGGVGHGDPHEIAHGGIGNRSAEVADEPVVGLAGILVPLQNGVIPGVVGGKPAESGQSRLTEQIQPILQFIDSHMTSFVRYIT